MNFIDKRKNECWKLQKFKWTKFQIVIIFYFDNWQTTDFLKEVIMNISNSFIFAKILTSFRDHFVFFCRFMIHHSICISWLNSDHSTAEYLDSFYSNSNFLRHSLCSDCHESNLIFSSLSVEAKCIFILETREKIMQRILCSARSARTSKSIATINSYDDEYKFLNVRRWRITFSFLINNEYFSIFDLNEFVNVLSFILFDMSFFRLNIILYILNLLSISNLIFYFLDCAIYHICFESRLKSVTFFFVLKE